MFFFPSTEKSESDCFYFYLTPTINKLPYSHVEETCGLSRAALRGEEDTREKARKERRDVGHVCGDRFTESNIEVCCS